MSLTQKLHDLFLLDQRVRGINGRLESADRRLQAQQAKLAQLTQQYVEMDDQLKHALVRTSELEKQAAELDDRINHQREVMNTVNNNKEYSALLIEVNTFKNDKSRIEDAALEQMTAVDSLRQEQEELESRVQQQRKLVAVAQTEVETCREDVSDQLEELTSQREAALDDLPGEMQSIFSRLVHIVLK